MNFSIARINSAYSNAWSDNAVRLLTRAMRESDEPMITCGTLSRSRAVVGSGRHRRGLHVDHYDGGRGSRRGGKREAARTDAIHVHSAGSRTARSTSSVSETSSTTSTR